MASPARKVSLGFSNAKVDEGYHIFYLYNDDIERKRTLAKFLQQGLLDGEKVLYLVHEMPPEEMKREFQSLGVDIDNRQQDFDLTKAHYTLCPDSCFSADFMLERVGEYYDNAIEQGYRGARGAGEMSWALESGRTTVKDLLEYESNLNLILAEHPLTTICQYDARRFDGAVILDMMRVHPVMIVQEQLIKNPYYIPPTAFLKEYNNQIRVNG